LVIAHFLLDEDASGQIRGNAHAHPPPSLQPDDHSPFVANDVQRAALADPDAAKPSDGPGVERQEGHDDVAADGGSAERDGKR
jgi:hypothetical protein